MNDTYLSYKDQLWQAGINALEPTAAELERGLELHRTLDVCDGYGFLPRVFTDAFRKRNEQLLDRGIGKSDWTRMYWAELIAAPGYEEAGAEEFLGALQQAGLKGLVQPINDIGESLEDAMTLMASYRYLCNRFGGHLFQATRAEELTAAEGGGRLGVVFSLTGLPIFGAGSMADPDRLMDWVEIWHRMGVRFMHMSYNRRNYFADGCTETADGGLSDLGKTLVERMNAVGVIPDISHSGARATAETLKASTAPVVATHVGCAAVYEHPRCKTDRELYALADTGGYAGIFAVPFFLGERSDLRGMLEHVRHAVKVVGAEHVTIGTDNSYLSPEEQRQIRPYPGRVRINRSGWKPEHQAHSSVEHLCGSLAWTNWPLLTVGLVQLGLSDTEIMQILGGNLRRVLKTAERLDAAKACASVA